MPVWINKYLGIPYKKLNCFQFVQYVLKDKYSFIVKDPPIIMPKKFKDMNDSIDDLFGDYLDPVSMQEPHDGCLVLMHGARQYNHLGLYFDIGGVGYILHSLSNCRQSICHPVRTLQRYGLSLEGYYQWLK